MNTVTYVDESETFRYVYRGLHSGHSTGIYDQKGPYHQGVGLYFYSTLVGMDPTQNERRASRPAWVSMCVQAL